MSDLPPIPTGSKALSPSKLNALNCPFRYEQIYRQKVKEPPLVAFQAGSLVHLVARNYYRLLSADKIYEGSLTLLETVIEDVWEKRDADIGPDVRADFYEFALALQWRIFDPETIAHTELMLAFDENWQPVKCPEEWTSERVRFGGVIDLVNVIKEENKPLVWAIDWTTGGLGATIEAHKNQQLRFYALLLYKNFGIQNVRITVDSLRTGARKTIDLDKNDHIVTQLFAESESAHLQAMTDWPPAPGANCSICQLQCPLYDDTKLNMIDKLGERDPEAMFGAGIIIEKALTKIKKALKGYAQLHDPIEVNGMVAEIRSLKKYDWPHDETRALLTELGYDPDEIGNLTATNLKKRIRNDDHYEAIKNLASETVQERFGFYKQRAGEGT